MQISVVMAVAFAGALGATSRFLLTAALREWWGSSPWPIAAINLIGCFGFGVVWSLAQGRMSPAIAIAVLVGFFGSFTTFSAFAFDCQVLLAERKFGWFAVNLLLQNGLGVMALWLGLLVGGVRS